MSSANTHIPLHQRPWPGLDVSGARILVTGFGVSGYAVVDQTLQRGAKVVAVDASTSESTRERAQILEVLGADIRLGVEHTRALPLLPDGQVFDVVVTSPGWRPDQPLLAEAAAADIPVWSEVELARRMQPADGPAWLTVTGTNGKTTVVTMLEQILRTAGLRAVAAGNVGLPIIEAALDPEGFDVLAVELSSFQLHWTQHLNAHASAILNITDDHLDWHGGSQHYAEAKGKVYEGTAVACFFNESDERTLRLLENADVVEGCRAIGVGLSVPGPSSLGLVENLLVERAFVEQRHHQAAELASLDDLAHLGAHGAAPHTVMNALFAAGLARSYGVEPWAIRDGLRSFAPGAHRNVVVASVDGVTYVNDSKATNPDSASAALAGVQKAVWIAGGDAKGAALEPLVTRHRERLRAVVLIGVDPHPFRTALEAAGASIPIEWVDPAAFTTAQQVMGEAVRLARAAAQEGDAVLLAPAAASIDQFANYAQRGDTFAAAVTALEYDS